jgi:undecaprenyl-diphosphatase
MVVGGLLAFASAYLCIQAFINLVERTGMLPYALYRFALGGVLLWLLA